MSGNEVCNKIAWSENFGDAWNAEYCSSILTKSEGKDGKYDAGVFPTTDGKPLLTTTMNRYQFDIMLTPFAGRKSRRLRLRNRSNCESCSWIVGVMTYSDARSMKDFYEILGVPRDATDDQVKKAFRKQAIKW